MNIGNLREMAKLSIRDLVTTSGGRGGVVPAVGAPLLSGPNHSPQANVATRRSPGETDYVFTRRTDRRGRSMLRYSSDPEPPSRQSYSIDVPISPLSITVHYNPASDNRLVIHGSNNSLSNHIAVTVDVDNSTLNNCARTGGTTIDKLPGPESYPDAGEISILSYTDHRRSLSFTHSWKGTVP